MRVVILGAGYVGCVSAACLAQLGHEIVAVDLNATKIEALNAGESPVLEAGLDEIIAAAVRSGRLRGASDIGTQLLDADVVMVCVATPSGTGGMTDPRPLQRVLEQLMAASRSRAHALPIAVRSTIRARTLRELAEKMFFPLQRLPMVVNPEFLREASAVKDFFHPPYLIAGGDDAWAVARVMALYEGIDAQRFEVDMETASLVKYASNAFHALKIAFANEIATVSDLEGADPVTVMELMRRDNLLNISPAYLRPGFAFGGSCLSKDLRALVALGLEAHEPLHLLSGVLSSNQRRIDQAVALVLARRPCRLAVLGLSFKSGTDDLRESPYVELAERLLGKGFELRICDPDLDPAKLIGANRAYVQEHLPHLGRLLVSTPDEALDGAAGVILGKNVLSEPRLQALIESGVEIYDLEYHSRTLYRTRPSAIRLIGPRVEEPMLAF